MTTLFISDLHLSGERPQIIQLFSEFLKNEASQADALYILGDLFEVWLGDDAITTDQQAVIDELKKLTTNGVPTYVMVGNRDFLIGEGFATLSGCQILSEPYILNLYGTPTLLMHGDTLCTDDVEYQEFRRMVRSTAWQQDFLEKPPEQRTDYATRAREESKARTRVKPVEIMDTNAQAVENALRNTRTARLIHGHTHRPAVHRLEVDHQPATRIVLGDWYTQQSVLRVDESGFELTHIGRANWC